MLKLKINRTIMNNLKKIFTGVTRQQSAEFGQVTILVAIFFALYLRENNFVIAAFILTLITIVVPVIFYPFAVLWFGMAKILNAVSMTVLMGLVFFIIVTPVGLFRRLTGRDSLKINQFKKGRQSVMTDRDHLYTGDDLLHTF